MQNQINSLGRRWEDGDILSLVALIRESGSVRCTPSFLHSSVCLHLKQWIYYWRWALYFSLHPWGCSRDILQPSHVPHKNCQWVRSKDFSKTIGALMHSNTLHYNDTSHQQYERERLTQKDGKRKGEREREVIKRLLLPNRQLSCQSHKSNQRLVASLPLSFIFLLLPSLFLFKSFSHSILHIC